MLLLCCVAVSVELRAEHKATMKSVSKARYAESSSWSAQQLLQVAAKISFCVVHQTLPPSRFWKAPILPNPAPSLFCSAAIWFALSKLSSSETSFNPSLPPFPSCLFVILSLCCTSHPLQHLVLSLLLLHNKYTRICMETWHCGKQLTHKHTPLLWGRLMASLPLPTELLTLELGRLYAHLAWDNKVAESPSAHTTSSTEMVKITH